MSIKTLNHQQTLEQNDDYIPKINNYQMTQ